MTEPAMTEHANAVDDAEVRESGSAVERRVHTDLPRVRPEDMVTSQDVTPARDPQGGRDTDREFMLRNAWL